MTSLVEIEAKKRSERKEQIRRRRLEGDSVLWSSPRLLALALFVLSVLIISGFLLIFPPRPTGHVLPNDFRLKGESNRSDRIANHHNRSSFGYVDQETLSGDIKAGANDTCAEYPVITAVPEAKRCYCSPYFHSQDDNLIDYISFVYCGGNEHSVEFVGRVIVLVLWLMFLFALLGDTADAFLVPALTTVSVLMQLSPQVAGVTMLALANGGPDFFTAMAAFGSSGDGDGGTDLGIGACLGAGMFITTAIFGSVILSSPEEGGGFHASALPFLRDILFYMVSLFLLFLFVALNEISVPLVLVLLAWYSIYIATVVSEQFCLRTFFRETSERLSRLRVISGAIQRLSTFTRDGERVEEHHVETHHVHEKRLDIKSWSGEPMRVDDRYHSLPSSEDVEEKGGGFTGRKLEDQRREERAASLSHLRCWSESGDHSDDEEGDDDHINALHLHDTAMHDDQTPPGTPSTTTCVTTTVSDTTVSTMTREVTERASPALHEQAAAAGSADDTPDNTSVAIIDEDEESTGRRKVGFSELPERKDWESESGHGPTRLGKKPQDSLRMAAGTSLLPGAPRRARAVTFDSSTGERDRQGSRGSDRLSAHSSSISGSRRSRATTAGSVEEALLRRNSEREINDTHMRTSSWIPSFLRRITQNDDGERAKHIVNGAPSSHGHPRSSSVGSGSSHGDRSPNSGVYTQDGDGGERERQNVSGIRLLSGVAGGHRRLFSSGPRNTQRANSAAFVLGGLHRKSKSSGSDGERIEGDLRDIRRPSRHRSLSTTGFPLPRYQTTVPAATATIEVPKHSYINSAFGRRRSAVARTLRRFSLAPAVVGSLGSDAGSSYGGSGIRGDRRPAREGSGTDSEVSGGAGGGGGARSSGSFRERLKSQRMPSAVLSISSLNSSSRSSGDMSSARLSPTARVASFLFGDGVGSTGRVRYHENINMNDGNRDLHSTRSAGALVRTGHGSLGGAGGTAGVSGSARSAWMSERSSGAEAHAFHSSRSAGSDRTGLRSDSSVIRWGAPSSSLSRSRSNGSVQYHDEAEEHMSGIHGAHRCDEGSQRGGGQGLPPLHPPSYFHHPGITVTITPTNQSRIVAQRSFFGRGTGGSGGLDGEVSHHDENEGLLPVPEHSLLGANLPETPRNIAINVKSALQEQHGNEEAEGKTMDGKGNKALEDVAMDTSSLMASSHTFSSSPIYGADKGTDATKESRLKRRSNIHLLPNATEEEGKQLLARSDEDLEHHGDVGEEEDNMTMMEVEGLDLGIGPPPEAHGVERVCWYISWFLGFETDEMGPVGKATAIILSPATLLRKMSIPLTDDDTWNKYFVAASPLGAMLALMVATGCFSYPIGGSPAPNHPSPSPSHLKGSAASGGDHVVGGIPAWVLVVVVGVVVVIPAGVWALPRNTPPQSRSFLWAANILAFISSCVWQYLLANEIVALLTMLGGVFGIPKGILGVTVVAWGNSIGDFFGDVALSRGGHPAMGAAGCFGGPVFNTCIALGVGLLIKAGSNAPNAVPLRGSGPSPGHWTVDMAVTVVSFVFLFITLTGTVAYGAWYKFHIGRRLGMALLGVYFFFVTLSVLIVTGAVTIGN